MPFNRVIGGENVQAWYRIPNRFVDDRAKVKKLGSGSQKMVFQVEDKEDGKKYALAYLRNIQGAPDDGLKYLLRELKMNRILDHENILSAKDYYICKTTKARGVYYEDQFDVSFVM